MPRAGASARKQEKLAMQSEAKPAATVETLFELKGVDACCAKVMNEFVELSGKPPTLKDIREVILPKVNVERQLRKRPPILESTLVKHIRKWKSSLLGTRGPVANTRRQTKIRPTSGT
jgi:hypothetical protein